MEWVVTDNIYRETWRRILELSNLDLAVEEIARRHGNMSAANRDDYIKQARQARVCALQAKEYFDAARASSVITSANHAYYGAVSLTSMLMLILGDGTKSLDFLRKDRRNAHHGLHFSTGCTAANARTGLRLVEQSFVEVLPNGHFSNWYTTLPSHGQIYGLIYRHEGGGGLQVNLEVVGIYSTRPLQTLIGTKRTILHLIQYLPDLQADLQRYSVAIASSRFTQEVHLGPGDAKRYRWVIHGANSSDALDAILSRFEIEPRYAIDDLVKMTRSTSLRGAVIDLAWTAREVLKCRMPESRDTVSNDTIAYADSIEVHEFVDLYMLAYQLSMLARYYPDIWISCLESHCRGAKLIERAVDVIVQKFPLFVLSMLSPEGLTISPHQPPWKGTPHRALV